ncbi:class I SAM-dependent methyltransferase [Jiangella asiatica]|uniref:Methyltransferase domain-containing protein n=1 Tax=Jiangella asiatica TaxID=2530372 RepID=A0A4R5DP79_9ACTN|nr:methyltransferase domain-containing protein [Jiangella asiatica]TDE13984.1 methyltransferase domain-containing protein [Jiangella asiatica]
MSERVRRNPRTEAIWTQLYQALAELSSSTGRRELDIVDLGGGSGVFAVPLARIGHRVTVVDPSPNALATLARRAADAGVGVQITGLQGDAAGLVAVAGQASADVVVCHGVLEVVDDPPAAVEGLAACLRPGGVASVVVAQRYAAVLAKALAGHLADARRLLDDPDGRWGASDPLPRRFDEPGLAALLTGGGLEVLDVHGVRFLTDLIAGAVVDDPADAAALADLEAAAVAHPAFRAVAAALHVVARKPAA